MTVFTGTEEHATARGTPTRPIIAAPTIGRLWKRRYAARRARWRRSATSIPLTMTTRGA
jgi:hypothetical protein